MSITLTPEQAAVVSDRGGELLVSAAAGSGKTRVLVERLLNRVQEEGLDLTDFLVITFTRAAAGELREKILGELNRRLSLEPEDWRLRRQAMLIYQAQISTIHAFCTVFLRENGYLLDLDADFRVAEDTEAALLRARTLERVLEERYEHLEENGFAELVDTFSAGRDDEKLREIVLDIYERIQSYPDPMAWLREQEKAFSLEGVRDAGKTVWGELLMKDAKAQAEYWRGQMVRALDILLESGDEALILAYSESINGTLDSLDDLISALERRWDSAQALRVISFPRFGSARKVRDRAAQERVKSIRERCKKSMNKLAERFESGSRELLEDLEAVREPVEQLFALVRDFHEAYGQAKRRRRLLDFNDLEQLTARALGNEELAKRWRQRYAEVMVDEYQDTNAVQNVIFQALTGGGKTLFQVGDIKQSIYRFRLADPTIFLQKYHTFVPGELAEPGEPRKLILSRNFRSRLPVLDAVNFVFQHLMSEAFGEIDYDEEQRLNPGLLDLPEREDDQVELDVVDLDAPREAEQAVTPRDQLEAEFVAKRVRQLLDEPFLVTDGEELRPVRAEEIAILYRSPGAVFGYLTAALDEQNIPWHSEGSEDLFACTEVSVALSFLEVIDNPRQDVPLLSVLRGPVYGCTPDQLAMLRAASPGTDLYTCVERGAAAGERVCQRFLDDLRLLRLRMMDRSCAQLLWDLYDQLGLLALFGAMPGGARRQENLLAFYSCARSFEAQGHRGLFAFVSQIRRLRERGKTPATAVRQTGSGVHILSIHRSKGLEFPVVVLAGLSRRMNRSDEMAPVLFHPQLGIGPKRLDPELRLEYPTLARTAVQLQLSRERKAEELRLLYVAMTRAREKLILVMSFTDAEQTMRKLLPDAGPHPEPEALSQLDSVGKWLLLPVLARWDAGALRFGETLGVYLESGVRWDIRLAREEGKRAAAAEAPSPEETEETAEWEEETLAAQLRWRYPFRELADLSSKVTATEMKGRLLDKEAEEEAPREALPLEFRRPELGGEAPALTGAQIGSAFHTVMEHIRLELADTPEGVSSELKRLTEGGWLTSAQSAAVVPQRIARFWASPLGREAANAPVLRREFKFSILAEAGELFAGVPSGEKVLMQGVVDCCFSDLLGVTVIDFKTDRVARGGERAQAERYRGQLEVYSRALEEIFGVPVIRRVVWFFSSGRGVEL